MKTGITINRRRVIMSGLAAALLAQICAFAVPPPAPGDIDVDTTIDPAQRTDLSGALATSIYRIADGVTLTFKNAPSPAANGGVFQVRTNLTFAPSGTLGTGKVVFENNTNTVQGGAINVNSGKLVVTNGEFRNNSSTAGNGGGAILFGSSATDDSLLQNVLFSSNYSVRGGAINNYGVFSLISGTFINNYADQTNTTTGAGGAVHIANATAVTTIANAAFISNRVARVGGAIANTNNANVALVDISEFTNNWSGSAGGAIYDNNNGSTGNGVIIRLSGSTDLTSFIYSGNVSGGVVAATAVVRSGTYAFTPIANAGGFYYATNSGLLRFDIAGGIDLSIGKASNNSAFDSIATSNAGTGAKLDKIGAGRLILHADNSYYQGAVNVIEGSLLLGNQNAKLGGAITVGSGATFGGLGTVETFNQSSARQASTIVTASTGATIKAGVDTALTAGVLAIDGKLDMKNGVTLSHDLFSSGSASLLSVKDYLLAGSGTIDLGLLETGTFTLATWSGSGISDASRLALTVNGGAETARSSGTLRVTGNELQVVNKVFSLEMKWTGATGTNWARRASGANWTDGQAAAEKNFRNGDRVIFDGESDAAAPERRVIGIDSLGVVVSDMIVKGTASYTFGGQGGITADASTIDGVVITGSGMLKKSGSGELSFTNTGTNTFLGGVDIAGGVVSITHGNQLNAGGNGIFFSDSGTLRAASSISGTLASKIGIGAAKSATIEVVEGGAFVYGGTISSGATSSALIKTGDGALRLTGNSASNNGKVDINDGALILDGNNAKLGGNLTVADGAVLGGTGEAGTGGRVAVAAGGILEMGADQAQSGTLSVNNLTLTGDAVLKFDLFAAADGALKQSDRLMENAASAISGTNIIDLTTFNSGTFNLGNITALANNSEVTLSGMTLVPGGRLSAELSGSNGYLQLITTSDKSRVITWTGSSGASWSLATKSWAGSGGVTQYSYGDRIIFNGTSDAAHAGNRTITIDGSQMNVSDMIVSADVDYKFTGNGGIGASKDYVMSDGTPAEITDATGKLIKSGSGTLSFANNANNYFEGGIDIYGGIISFERAGHLTTTGTGITFKGNSMLRAGADGIDLNNTFVIDDGVTAAFNSNGHVLTLSGTVIGNDDSTFAKTGSGAVVLAADVAAFTGTMAVIGGELRLGAADMLGNAKVVHINSGAVLNINDHTQTLSNLSGNGVVALGTADLTMDIASGTAAFAGGFTGDGKVIKTGDGKWVLSGVSNHTGGMLLEQGALGIASNTALGTGALSIGTSSPQVTIEAAGLVIPNALNMGAHGAVIANDGYLSEFSGTISGNSTLSLQGTGTIALSGRNSYMQLDVKNARTIARRVESLANNVYIDNGSVLEFRNVPGGSMNSHLHGSLVLFNSSTLTLGGTNTLQNFVVSAGSKITAGTANAIGGQNADILVNNSSILSVTRTDTLGRNLSIDGGVLLFGEGNAMGSLALSGTMSFLNGGELKLGGILPTNIYTVAIAAGGIPEMPVYTADQGGMFMLVDIIDGDKLVITAYNKALEPGKDIVVGMDSMIASMNAVHAHINEEFLSPLFDYEDRDIKRSLWFRGIGSFAKYGDDMYHLGYTDTTYAGIIGYDMTVHKNMLAGCYFGYSVTKLETTNDATTDMSLPYAGFYGAWRKGDFYMSGDVTLGFGIADTVRREDFGNIVTGDYELDTFGGSFEVGYMFHPFAAGGLRPSVALQYMNLSFHDYAETGVGAVRLDDFSTYSLQAVIGCEASKQIKLPWGMPGMVDLRLGWRQNLQASRSEIWATLVDHPGPKLKIRGDDYDANGLSIGLGLRMAFSPRASLALAYDCEYIPLGNQDSDTRRHTFNTVFRVTW